MTAMQDAPQSAQAPHTGARQAGARFAQLMELVRESVSDRSVAEVARLTMAGEDAPTQTTPLQPGVPPPPPPPKQEAESSLTLQLQLASGTADANQGAGSHSIPPSSWLPIAGYRLRSGRLRHALARVRSIATSLGVTQLQLLMLSVLAPLVTAIAIDLVARLLSAR